MRHTNHWTQAVLALVMCLTLSGACLTAPAQRAQAQSGSEGDVFLPVIEHREGPGFRLLGHIGGQATEVIVREPYAYVAFGPELAVLDLSNPARITRAGYITLDAPIIGMAMDGDIVYASAGVYSLGRLYVVNVANPAHPYSVNYVGESWLLNGVGDVAVDDGNLFALYNDQDTIQVVRGLAMLDIRRPDRPTVISHYSFHEGEYMGRLLLSKKAAYARGGNSVVDISDPHRIIGADPLPLAGVDMAVVGDTLYVASDQLYMLDASDPLRPTITGSYATEQPVQRLAAYGDTLFAVVGSQTLILDVSAPDAPVELGVWPDAALLAGTGDTLYVAGARGFQAVDISQLVPPALVSSLDTPGDASAVVVQDGVAYVADRGGGLRLIDLSDPQAMVELAHLDTPGDAYGVDVAGGYAYVADGSQGLAVVDVSTVTSPTLVAELDTPGVAVDVAVAGHLAYVADDGGGLRVLDLADPAQPTEVHSVPLAGEALDVALSGETAAVALGGAGLSLLSLAVPAKPAAGAVFTGTEFALGVALSGTNAYVAAGPAGVQVIDISDPGNPRSQSAFNTPGSATRIVISGTQVYVADGAKGLRVFDVGDPSAAVDLGAAALPGEARDVAVAGAYAYVAGGSSGLHAVSAGALRSPAGASVYATIEDVLDVAGVGGYAVVVDGSDKLTILDVRDPERPLVVARHLLSAEGAFDVEISGGTAVVLTNGPECRLHVMDIDDPAHPIHVSDYFVSEANCSSFPDTQIVNGYVYLVLSRYRAHEQTPHYEEILHVVDISDPQHPRAAATHVLADVMADVRIHDAVVSVGRESESTVDILDFSDPAKPRKIAQLPGHLADVLLSNETAYVASEAALAIYDLSDSDRPILLASSPLDISWVRNLQIIGNVLLIGHTQGVTAVDLDALPRIEEAGFFPLRDAEFAFDGSVIYAFYPYYGDWQMPQGLLLLGWAEE